MNIEVNGKKYDIRFRQEFVPSSKSGRPVRQTTATLSSIDPTKIRAAKYTVLHSVTLVQSVKDKDNKLQARKIATTKIINKAFNRIERKMLWEKQLLPIFEPETVAKAKAKAKAKA